MKILNQISLFVSGLSFCCCISLNAQTKEGITHSGQLTGQAPFPIQTYSELPNPTSPDQALWSKVKGLNVSWGSTDIRYKKEEPAPMAKKQKILTLTGWKGEQVAAQFVVWSNEPIESLSYTVSSLSSTTHKGETINTDRLFSGFVRYVMTDELNKDGKGACGNRPDATAFDSSLVADPIDHLTKALPLAAETSQGVWVRVNIPQDVPVGLYEGTVTVHTNAGMNEVLRLQIKVLDHVLPPSSEWAFHLDLWQNPFASARYYGVTPWSREHFDCMRPEMELYAKAGGKVITAPIMHKPWNGQTYDYFETMVTWMKKADGSWTFDYTVFDKWVEYMMSLGVDKQINCYSMVPWRLSFQYFDQATNSLCFIETKPGEQAFEEMWTAMLKSFAAHLKEKGWFDITYISMDERPLQDMMATLKVIRQADKDFKTSLAGALHEELISELDDYCVALRMKYTDEMKKQRKASGKTTTFYTSCEEPRPNTFSFNPPAECEWFGWYAAKENLDGYLRWAYNSWVIEPLLDSRFYTWAGGDTYLVYPAGRTSMRFERMIAGIQAYEKIRLLRQELEVKKDRKGINRLNKALELFDESTLEEKPAAAVIQEARRIVNTF